MHLRNDHDRSQEGRNICTSTIKVASTHFLPPPFLFYMTSHSSQMAKKDTPFHCLIARIMPLMSTAQTLAEKNRVRPQPPDCSCGEFPPPEAYYFRGGGGTVLQDQNSWIARWISPTRTKESSNGQEIEQKHGQTAPKRGLKQWRAQRRSNRFFPPNMQAKNRYQPTNGGKNTMTQVSADNNLKKPHSRNRNSPTGYA